MAHFFEVYKNLEHKQTKPSQSLGRSEAEEIIKDSMDRYQYHYCGKRDRRACSLETSATMQD